MYEIFLNLSDLLLILRVDFSSQSMASSILLNLLHVNWNVFGAIFEGQDEGFWAFLGVFSFTFLPDLRVTTLVFDVGSLDLGIGNLDFGVGSLDGLDYGVGSVDFDLKEDLIDL